MQITGARKLKKVVLRLIYPFLIETAFIISETPFFFARSGNKYTITACIIIPSAGITITANAPRKKNPCAVFSKKIRLKNSIALWKNTAASPVDMPMIIE
jgi:hypothetical protein